MRWHIRRIVNGCAALDCRRKANGPASNLAVNLVSNLGPVLLLVGMGHLGHRMRSGQAADATAGIVETSA